MDRRRERLGPGLELSYDRPLHPVRGEGVWLTDAEGRTYLDTYNNVPHVGHCHPAVVKALARQAATLNTNTRYLYDSLLEYSDRLTATMPGDLSVCMFVCSGSEANDLAWRLAKAHTGNTGAITIESAYHGTTDAIFELSPAEHGEGRPLAEHVATVPAPDGYRGRYRREDPRYASRSASCLDEAIASLGERGFVPAAFYLDLIGDIRGAGLFIGVDLVRDRATCEPASAEADSVANRMREDGVLIGLDGPEANVLKIRPPLVFDETHVELLADALDDALRAI